MVALAGVGAAPALDEDVVFVDLMDRVSNFHGADG